jgi:HK97 family phage major capsid protein
MNLKDLRTQRAEAVEEMQLLSGQLDEGFDLAAHRQFKALKSHVGELDAQIARAQHAVPVDSHERRTAPMRCSNLKVFKDQINARGQRITAAEQAYGFGKLLQAEIFKNDEARSWLKERGLYTKAQVEGVGTSGGVLVPDEWLNTIINLKEQFGVFAKYAQKVPMNRDSKNVPRRTGGLTAYFVGEGALPSESSLTWDNAQLSAKKIMTLTRISTELSEDAMTNIADWIAGEIAYACASKEDDCGFLGDGTLTYGGIQGLKTLFVTNTAGVYTATGHTTFDALTMKDITLWMGYLPQFALPNAKFYCSQTFFSSVFLQLAGTGGGNTLRTIADGMGYQFLGRPVVISQKLPTTASVTGSLVAYYGDLEKAAMFADKRQVTIKRSNERHFDTDQVGIAGKERFDIVVHDVGTSSIIGPLVALKMG